MNARLDLIIDEARALSTADQDRLADMMAVYVASHAAPPALNETELAELRRRHEAPFAAAPDHAVTEFFARHRG